MTRDEVKKEIAIIFQKRYNKNFYDIDENLPLASLLDLDDRIDSLEIIEFLFDIEDKFNLKNINSTGDKDSAIKDVIDVFYHEVNKNKQ